MPNPISEKGRKQRSSRIFRKSARERVVEALREDITQGQQPPGTRLISIPELARAYRTSLTTMQQALNDLERDGYVVKRHGSGTYIADTVAGPTMADTVVLCMESRGHVSSDLTRLLSQTLLERGKVPVLVNTSSAPGVRATCEEMLGKIARTECCAMIFNGSRYFPFEILRNPVFDSKALVALMNWETEETFPRVRRILSDGWAGGEMVAEHLYAAGHRTVLVAGTPPQIEGLRERSVYRPPTGFAFARSWEGFGCTLETLPLDERERNHPADEELGGRIRDIFLAPNAPTAVFGTRDIEALVVRQALQVHLPERLSAVEFVGYHDTPWSRTSYPPFSSVNLNLRAVAEQAGNLIVRALSGETGSDPVTMNIPPRLALRGGADVEEEDEIL